MGEMALQTEGLSRRFGSVQAVTDLTLSIPRGIVFGFLGPNGSGKTTTIRLLLGLLEPSAGRATVLGFDSLKEGDRIRAQAGALLEHHGLYERLSAEENLEFYARVWRLPPKERQERIRELLENLGLWGRRHETAGSWSRGMKQKLAVARALLHRPALLFLDEPTAGLDPVAAAALREDLARLVEQEGTTVFLTTHNLAEAEKLCSLVGVIREGRLISVGHPDDLRRRSGGARAEFVGRGFDNGTLALLRAQPEVAQAELRNGHLVVDLKGEGEVAPLVKLIVAHGGEVEEVRKGSASLEEAFLALMEEEK
jgi:ABC-2 type transport system ATP-binding protein